MSLALHGMGYLTLVVLEGNEGPAARPVRTSRLEWLELDPIAGAPEPEPAEPLDARERDLRELRDTVEPTPEPEVAPRPEQPERTPEPQLTPQPEAPAPTPPEIPDLSRQAIEQESDNPAVEAPPDAQYIAAENRRVEEETVATDQSLRSDSPTAAPPPPDGDPSDGVEPTDEPSEQPEEGSATATGEAPPTRGEETAHASVPNPSTSPPAETGARAVTAASEGAHAQPSPAAPTETFTYDDGFGTITIERPRPAMTGPRDPREHGGSSTTRRPSSTAPNLRVGYAAFEGIYGSDQLAAERAERRAQREALAATSGHGRRERWEQYRFAAENFLPTVRPGNQTALNAAASPYASWIAAVHRRIHAQFAERFIPRIAHNAAMSNPDLYAEMEFVVDANGRVLRVAITHTSGMSAFDLGAFNSILDAQPLPSPPEAIWSGDGRVYIIWGFARGPSQCHTMQARPFILPNPPPLVAMPGVTIDDSIPRPRSREIPEPPTSGDETGPGVAVPLERRGPPPPP